MAGPKTYGLTHLAIAVRDIERTLQFYRAVFEVEVMYRQGGFLQVTTPGCDDIVVFEERKADFGTTGGIAHFGYRLRHPEDIRELGDRIRGAGGTIHDEGEFAPGEPYLFFRDPDGYEVEVWFEADESARVSPSVPSARGAPRR